MGIADTASFETAATLHEVAAKSRPFMLLRRGRAAE